MAMKRDTADNVKADMEKRFPKVENEKPVKDKMIQLNFRMKESEYKKLMAILDREGRLLSQGVRAIVREWLEKKNAL